MSTTEEARELADTLTALCDPGFPGDPMHNGMCVVEDPFLTGPAGPCVQAGLWLAWPQADGSISADHHHVFTSYSFTSPESFARSLRNGWY